MVYVLVLVCAMAGPSTTASAQRIQSVESVGMTVSDIDRSVEFFNKVLSFEKISDTEVHGEEYEKLQGVFGLRMRVVRMRLGQEIVDLTQYLAPEGRPIPAGWQSNDQTFQHIAVVVSDMDKAYRHLRAYRVRHGSSGPQTIPASNLVAAGIRAFYFKDPDGHYLEIIYFPPGKGDPRWQQTSGRLFLGIDHTAIVVSDTARSLMFYRDSLGFKVAGESINHGIEQERLNNVAGARLRITGLKTESGPGVEFLEYLAPRNGRPFPKNTGANDIWHWQTTLETDNAAHVAQKLRRASAGRLVSPGVALLPPHNSLNFKKGFLAHDPDGHGLRFIER